METPLYLDQTEFFSFFFFFASCKMNIFIIKELKPIVLRQALTLSLKCSGVTPVVTVLLPRIPFGAGYHPVAR